MKVVKDLSELTNELTIVDFFATWCGPCKMLGPNLEEISDNGVCKVLKIDCDESLELAQEFKVSSIPALFLFKDKKVVSQKLGYMDVDELEDWVNEYK